MYTHSVCMYIYIYMLRTPNPSIYWPHMRSVPFPNPLGEGWRDGGLPRTTSWDGWASTEAKLQEVSRLPPPFSSNLVKPHETHETTLFAWFNPHQTY